MDRLFAEGYAVKSVNSNSVKNVWYVPHFGVQNENKPGKVRLVFDAGHRYAGSSLNDSLLPGPDLLKSLFGTLVNFRTGRIAIKGDIRDMFLRVKVRAEDRPYQRFLWRGKDRINPPQVFEMSSLIFGSKSSPCSANYVKNLNAESFKDQFPESAQSIVSSTYMDDYLESLNSIKEAKKRV